MSIIGLFSLPEQKQQQHCLHCLEVCLKYETLQD